MSYKLSEDDINYLHEIKDIFRLQAYSTILKYNEQEYMMYAYTDITSEYECVDACLSYAKWCDFMGEMDLYLRPGFKSQNACVISYGIIQSEKHYDIDNLYRLFNLFKKDFIRYRDMSEKKNFSDLIKKEIPQITSNMTDLMKKNCQCYVILLTRLEETLDEIAENENEDPHAITQWPKCLLR
jgi:hypothetical protein